VREEAAGFPKAGPLLLCLTVDRSLLVAHFLPLPFFAPFLADDFFEVLDDADVFTFPFTLDVGLKAQSRGCVANSID
jgi:hypothetical protein